MNFHLLRISVSAIVMMKKAKRFMDDSNQNTQNVVHMTEYGPDQQYAALSQVEGYWDALRGDKLVPKRSDIDPRGIEHALEYAFILERIAPGVARLRIAGSHLSDLMGMEVRGMPITSFLVPASRRRFSDTMEELFETPATATVHLKADVGRMTARMLLLPLKSDMGDTSRMLGCLVTHGDLAETPCRFEIQQIDLIPIVNRPVKGALPVRSPVRETGFAEIRHEYAPKAKTARPPYLRLVKSDD